MKTQILVVDDEPAIVESMCMVLEAFGYNAVGANSGVEAVAKVADFCPTLLLSDIVMPALNGFEAALQIKAKCPHCRLLFFSGYAGAADMGDSLKAQGYRFEI